jgi:hypothetical protein
MERYQGYHSHTNHGRRKFQKTEKQIFMLPLLFEKKGIYSAPLAYDMLYLYYHLEL